MDSENLDIDKEEAELLRQQQEIEERLKKLRSKKSAVNKTDSERYDSTPHKEHATSEAGRDEAAQPASNVLASNKMSLTTYNNEVTKVTPPADWPDAAFGACASDFEWSRRLDLLNVMQREMGKPPLTFKQPVCPGESLLQSSEVGKELCLCGILKSPCTYSTDSSKGKRKKHKRGTINFNIAISTGKASTDSIPSPSTAVVSIVIVESGIGENNFRKIITAFEANSDSENQTVVLSGEVQANHDAFHVCVNNNSHILLIGVKPPIYPVVHDMNGTPITFPLDLDENNNRRLVAPFSDAWFCPIAGSKLSKEQVVQLQSHISAYRSSGGGVIYLGLKITMAKSKKSDLLQVEDASIELSREQLEVLKKEIETHCKDQRPKCCAKEWNLNESRTVYGIKQRLDDCFNSYFSTSSHLGVNRYVIRMIICPSEHPLHLNSESDIGLRIRHGETRSFYQLGDFVKKMSEVLLEVEQEVHKLEAFVPNSSAASSCKVINGENLHLWQMMAPEGGDLDNKGCIEKEPVNYIVSELTDYGAMWLNDTISSGGTIRIGVSNMPPLVNGVWLDEDAMQLLKKRLYERFRGSLDAENFCFPSAIEQFTLMKHHVVADTNALIGKDSKVLVLWLKVTKNPASKNQFDSFDNVRRNFYHSCAEDNNCYVLTKLFGSKTLSLVLPLNIGLDGLHPPADGAFPVAISKHSSLDQSQQDDVVDNLVIELQNRKSSALKIVIGFEFLEVSKTADLLDPNYCVLDVIIHPGSQDILHLCKLPVFWKLDLPSDLEHIGRRPVKMNFQDIVLRCKGSNLATIYLSNFFQFNDRPILITDLGSWDPATVSGLARIPWTMVIDFDFGNSNTLRKQAENAPYVYKIQDLPLYKGFIVNAESMPDAASVYWVKALGPPAELIKEPNEWCLHYSSQLSKYITLACGSFASHVKVFIVWSASDVSSSFGQVIAQLCLDAQRAQPGHTTEIALVSDVIVSPFLSKFKKFDLPRPPKVLPMDLSYLCTFLSQGGQIGAAIDGISAHQRGIPGKNVQLPVETVRSMKAGEMEYLFPGFENNLDVSNYDNGLAFFEGRRVRWEDFKAKNVVDRHETKELYDRVHACLKAKDRREPKEIVLLHSPGAGGSTIARDVMWRFKKLFCCVVPSKYYTNLRKDIKQLIDASEGRAVLVLCDTNSQDIEFDNFMSALKGLKAVILRVERLFENQKKERNQQVVQLDESLSLEMLEEFVQLLRKNTNLSESKDALDLLLLSAHRMQEKIPLFLVMVTALEKRFLPLRDYVKERLVGINNEQTQLLLRIAFARLYTGRALQVRAVCNNDKNLDEYIPTTVSGLITYGWQQSGRVRTRHHCIDELVLSELSKCDTTSVEWGKWLAEFVVNFIDHLRVVYQNNIPESDHSGNNEFERILRRLFHEKSSQSQIPYFLSLMGTLAGKDAVIVCMRGVITKLPKISRIHAHFLGDLARAHLHLKNMALNDALEIMKDAHELFPDNRTLYHQEGQLYFDAMKLSTTNNLLASKKPIEIAKDVIKLAKQASDSFSMSRKCKVHGRTSELVPWHTDLRCHMECLYDVFKIMDCSFHTLPPSLAQDEYIVHASENMMLLLETFSTEDPAFYRESRLKILHLLGTKEDYRTQLTSLFREIDGGWCLEVEVQNDRPQNHLVSSILGKTSSLLRMVYGSARDVPQNLSTRLTLAIASLIEQPRFINSVLAPMGHSERVTELELLWEWSRYSKQPVTSTGILNIINQYLQNLSSPSLLRAKCLLYKGVTLLLQLLCENNQNVNPDDIMRPISECKNILESVLQNENRNWRYREFLITGYGNGLLSSKDWFWYGPIHREVNECASLNSGYEDAKRIHFRTFSGTIIELDDHQGALVCCEGLQIFSNTVLKSWTMNATVNFHISVSSQKGLLAIPVCPPDPDNHPLIHRWLPNRCQEGRIHSIDKSKGLIYFGPPDLMQPFGAKACCRFDDPDIFSCPEEGDLYEFRVDKVMQNGNLKFIASELRFIKSK